MSARLLHNILKQTSIVSMQGQTDSDQLLLERFTRSNDETAFAKLLQRYCRLVWSVCRQMLDDETNAEDAFQATFLTLVKSSALIRGPLAPWLHRVAFRISQKLRRSSARRWKREQKAARTEADAPVSAASWNALLALVHEEVARLPEALRIPVVLCCLEGWPTSIAAKHVGWKLGTFSSRLSQAKQKLLTRLASRGLPATAIGLTMATAGSASAVNPRLILQTNELAGSQPQIAAHLLALTHGVVPMKSTLFQCATVVLVMLGFAGATSWLAASPQSSQLPPPDAAVQASKGSMGNIVDAPSGSKMLYLFLPLSKPLTQEEYVQLFSKYEAKGWEFAGTAPVLESNKQSADVHTNLIFRQPRGNVVHSISSSKGSHPLPGSLPRTNDSLTASSQSGGSAGTTVQDVTDTFKVAKEVEQKHLLEGVWRRVKAYHNDKEYAGGALSMLRFTKTNFCHVDVAEKEMHFTINPEKTPNELTLFGQGALFQCIYRMDGDKLIIAFFGRSEYDRPKSFSLEAKPADLPLFVYEYVRQRK